MMTNDELKKKIVKVLQELRASKPIVPNDYGLQIISCTTDREIADALIAAEIGDVKESENKATAAELVAQVSASTAIEKIAEWKHRAEVAELVVKNLNDIFTFDYQAVFEQAEKELAEEGK